MSSVSFISQRTALVVFVVGVILIVAPCMGTAPVAPALMGAVLFPSRALMAMRAMTTTFKWLSALG